MKVVISIDPIFKAVTVGATDDTDKPLPENVDSALFTWRSLIDGTCFWYNAMLSMVDNLEDTRKVLDIDVDSIKRFRKLYGSAQELIDDNERNLKPITPEGVVEPKTDAL